MGYSLFTSESVCAGHPDKICDQVSDAVLDACLKQDQNSHTAIECLATSGQLIIAGETRTKAKVDYQEIGRQVVKSLGYDQPLYHFDWQRLEVKVLVHQQSADIAQGVTEGGAGDQGLMFGYACKETEQLMPLPIMLAHGLVRQLDQVKEKELTYLRPDGKSQVVVSYEDGQPKGVEKVVLAVPHDPQIDNQQVKKDLLDQVVKPVLSRFKQKPIKLSQLIVNGTGQWAIGGPHSDMGETGRKIVVDSYGGMARVGGGCFSGKDPTKVDRSAAYAARLAAKNIVAANLADRCELLLGYVIGQAKPICLSINTFGTAKKTDKTIQGFVKKKFDFSVKGIINNLDLLRPIYQQTAVYGHFGKKGLPWEKVGG